MSDIQYINFYDALKTNRSIRVTVTRDRSNNLFSAKASLIQKNNTLDDISSCTTTNMSSAYEAVYSTMDAVKNHSVHQIQSEVSFVVVDEMLTEIELVQILSDLNIICSRPFARL